MTATHHIFAPHRGTADARRLLLLRRTALADRSGDHVNLELVELDAALARLDAGTWGRCEHCGGAIGRDRLRAVPEARACLPCGRK